MSTATINRPTECVECGSKFLARTDEGQCECCARRRCRIPLDREQASVIEHAARRRLARLMAREDPFELTAREPNLAAVERTARQLQVAADILADVEVDAAWSFEANDHSLGVLGDFLDDGWQEAEDGGPHRSDGQRKCAAGRQMILEATVAHIEAEAEAFGW